MERLYCSQIETSAGVWQICATERGVCSVRPGYGECPEENVLSQVGAQELAAYFDGTIKKFTVPLDLHGTEFQKQVWKLLMQIPYGTTRTYGQIAAMLGNPKAAQAVGQAVGKNPCLIMVPCHRILGKDGRLTGFSGGIPLKRLLLRHESIDFLPE